MATRPRRQLKRERVKVKQETGIHTTAAATASRALRPLCGSAAPPLAHGWTPAEGYKLFGHLDDRLV